MTLLGLLQGATDLVCYFVMSDDGSAVVILRTCSYPDLQLFLHTNSSSTQCSMCMQLDAMHSVVFH